MKRLLFTLLAAWLIFTACNRDSRQHRLLVYYAQPSSVRHNQRVVIDSLAAIGRDEHFVLDSTSDPRRFTDDSLKAYTAVLFLNVDGDQLPFPSRVALKRYMEAGGGFIDIGLTGNEEYDWAWYRNLLGGASPFGDHVFCTLTGEGDLAYRDAAFRRRLATGIRGVLAASTGIDLSRATTVYPPAEGHFHKETLVPGPLFEPTEMTVLPNLDVLFLQRRGQIMLYKSATHTLKQAGFLDVYYKTNKPKVNVEEGMLGLCKDPDFSNNHWIYIYYSVHDSAMNRLSRFLLVHDTVDPATEKPILEVHTQRDICCHTGGSLAFDRQGLLYVSTGDNSTPFDEDGQAHVSNGYAPLDDRPGHEQYDAERSAGNTNDLRGKILRVRPLTGGGYAIPQGNLFPPGTPKTRPEIYVMGDRNPYRISIDQKTGYLYWGEVGPDANPDSLDVRGPRGYDEVNQARRAGNFGWPFLIGDNYAYHHYDYATGAHGPAFDPAGPENTSRNNTGLTTLPPGQPAFVWYPYALSPEFPEVGTGGRNAMAGPVYYTDLYPPATRYPDYYNGKLFIYDWIRGWIKAVTMAPDGDLQEMEPFMPDMKMHNCIDMEAGPDGRLYLLEYGTAWFGRNADAGLFRIDYDSSAVSPPAEDTAAVTPPAGKAILESPVAAQGRTLFLSMDCKGCHQEASKSIGPSLVQVAEKYAGTPGAEALLTRKVIKGGSGVWGDVAMSAHPDISRADLHRILEYILSLSPKKGKK